MLEHKLAGCCTLCDKPVFNIIKKYPNNHLLAGEPRTVGEPLATAMRLTLLLSGGENMDLTFCSDCDVSPDTFPAIWKKVMGSFKRELDPVYVKALNPSFISTPEQMAFRRKTIRDFVFNLPLFILSKEKWSEIYAKSN